MISGPTRVLLIASVIWVLGDGMLGPLFAVFAEEVGGNIFDITYAWAIFLIVTGVGIIIVGKLSDWLGRQILMLIGYVCSTIFTFGYLWVNSPSDLFIIQAGLGVGLALSQPTWMALYDKYSGDGRNDGLLWGLTDGLAYTFSGIAIVLGGVIVTHFSFDTLFIVMGTLMAISTIYQAKILRYRE